MKQLPPGMLQFHAPLASWPLSGDARERRKGRARSPYSSLSTATSAHCLTRER